MTPDWRSWLVVVVRFAEWVMLTVRLSVAKTRGVPRRSCAPDDDMYWLLSAVLRPVVVLKADADGPHK